MAAAESTLLPSDFGGLDPEMVCPTVEAPRVEEPSQSSHTRQETASPHAVTGKLPRPRSGGPSQDFFRPAVEASHENPQAARADQLSVEDRSFADTSGSGTLSARSGSDVQPIASDPVSPVAAAEVSGGTVETKADDPPPVLEINTGILANIELDLAEPEKEKKLELAEPESEVEKFEKEREKARRELFRDFPGFVERFYGRIMSVSDAAADPQKQLFLKANIAFLGESYWSAWPDQFDLNRFKSFLAATLKKLGVSDTDIQFHLKCADLKYKAHQVYIVLHRRQASLQKQHAQSAKVGTEDRVFSHDIETVIRDVKSLYLQYRSFVRMGGQYFNLSSPVASKNLPSHLKALQASGIEVNFKQIQSGFLKDMSNVVHWNEHVFSKRTRWFGLWNFGRLARLKSMLKEGCSKEKESLAETRKSHSIPLETAQALKAVVEVIQAKKSRVWFWRKELKQELDAVIDALHHSAETAKNFKRGAIQVLSQHRQAVFRDTSIFSDGHHLNWHSKTAQKLKSLDYDVAAHLFKDRKLNARRKTPHCAGVVHP
ncbi:MAG: hypothetical protein EBX40_02230 [Gammaproteobacteria bacterium]|nr:hypothetical protein [Gammaproteobacteria bacterium]